MKRKIWFSLLVIIMAIAPFKLIAQNTEEHIQILEQKRIGDSVVRLTIEVQSDSALCPPMPQKSECYVFSQKMKKYIYINIKETPGISEDLIQSVFEKPGKWLKMLEGNQYSLPRFFNSVKNEYTYSKFPWIWMSTTHASGYYVKYNNETNLFKTEQKTLIETSKYEVAGWIVFLYVIISSFLFIGLRKKRKGKFTTAFAPGNSGLALVIILSVIFISCVSIENIFFFGNDYGWIPPVIYSASLFPLYLLLKLLYEGEYYDFPKSGFYFFSTVSQLLSLLFWSVNHQFYYWILPILMVGFLLHLFYLKCIDFKEELMHLTGW